MIMMDVDAVFFLFFFSVRFPLAKIPLQKSSRNPSSKFGELAVIISFFPKAENPALESRDGGDRQGKTGRPGFHRERVV